jgi:hypothetical protein
MTFQSGKKGLSEGGVSVRFIAEDQGKWGGPCGAMRDGVVEELSRG